MVPNSTCPNWRREFKKWAPDIRVVAYYGGKDARKLIYSHELFPGGVSDMRAHVVISSYEAPADDPFFKKIQWAGLVVDEGQRLKNDETRLYRALTDLRVPFRALLTGLQSLSLGIQVRLMLFRNACPKQSTGALESVAVLRSEEIRREGARSKVQRRNSGEYL